MTNSTPDLFRHLEQIAVDYNDTLARDRMTLELASRNSRRMDARAIEDGPLFGGPAQVGLLGEEI